MSKNNYSIVIRTLGNAGGKYQQLLNSIKSQTLQPLHIYVVLPEGYNLPPEKLGMEEFIFTHKGMWHQRIFGLDYASKHGDELLLACDDDISFEPDFAEKITKACIEIDGDIIVPYMEESGNGRLCSRKRFIYYFLGNRRGSRKKTYSVRIGCTGGYIQSNYKAIDIQPTQSGIGACLLVSNKCFTQNHYFDEAWLDANSYAIPEDQVFCYKAFLNRRKVFTSSKIRIKHLDNGSSSPDRIKNSAYATAKNFLIFWHRFLWEPAKSAERIKYFFGINYRIINNCIFYTFFGIYLKQNLIKLYLKGLKDGLLYLNSIEYKELHRVAKCSK